jgi:D-3-phosphoglycerate dehydrogenase
MPHLLIAGKLHPAGLDLLNTTPGLTFDYVEEVSEPSYAGLIHKADGLVLRTQPLTAATVARAERLKVVSRHGVGYDAVDLAALNARGIALAIVGDVNSVSVAEHAMMLLLACAKRARLADRAVREPEHWGWRNRLEAGEVGGKRLLILGYGRAGRHLARMAQGFAMQVRAFDPFLAAQGWPAGEVAPVATLAEGLAWADAVSVHVPKAGRPLLGAAELALLRPGAILVNTARGGIVDETALAGALATGRVGAAGLDVFDAEPPPPDHPLLAFDQVILSPHIAGLTAECAERMAVASVQNALDYLDGRLDPALLVNKDALACHVLPSASA